MLTIGKLAARADITTEALRHYEREHLLVPDGKSAAGYRLYQPGTLSRIHFIRQAKQCGFTLAEIRELLALQQGSQACCGDVRQLAIEKKLQIEGRIRAMKTMSAALDILIADCKTGTRPVSDCPILAALADVRSMDPRPGTS